jgi:hypothetical protein
MIVKSIEVGMLQVNCYVLGCEATGEGVVIDPGDDAPAVLELVRRLGLKIVGGQVGRLLAQSEGDRLSGREFLRKPTELADVQATLRGASPAERKWYERGVVESVRGKIDSTPDLTGNRNILPGFWENPADRAKLDAVVPDRRRGLLGGGGGRGHEVSSGCHVVPSFGRGRGC